LHAIAAVGDAYQGEQRLELAERKGLTGAQGPVSWSEIKGEGLDGADEYFHDSFILVWALRGVTPIDRASSQSVDAALARCLALSKQRANRGLLT
jgi:hypothetical protein